MVDLVTDGYTVLPAVADVDTVASLRARIDEFVASRGDGVDVRAGTVWIRDAGVLGDGVERLIAAPEVLAAVADLLGPNPVPVGSVMRNPVGGTAQQALHVDWAGPIQPGGDQQVQAMFFLDDVAVDNGPPRIVPGSHRSRAVPPRAVTDVHAAHRDQVTVTARAGDVLVFSSHAWHSGTANRSGRPRRVITATYRRAG